MEKIFNIEDIKEVVKEILNKISNENKNQAAVLAFSGDLGSGKTTIAKEISKQLGIQENVISPTFVIMKVYKTKNNIFKNLIHIDAYRLENSSELLHLGWEEIVKNKENLIIVEWPEIVASCIPENSYRIELEHKDETTRSIKFYS